MVLFGKIVFLHALQHKAVKVVLGVVLNEVQMVFGFIIYFAAVSIVVVKCELFANEYRRTHPNTHER